MKFEDLVGNDKVKNMLKNSINENNILPEAFDPKAVEVVSKAVKDHIEKK